MTPQMRLAKQARERFVAGCEGVMEPLAEAIRARLIELVDQSTSTKEMQDRRDAMLEFDRLYRNWVAGVPKAWRKALVPPSVTGRSRLDGDNLSLIGDDVVEKKILSSRLALAVLDKASWELNDLRLRMQHLEGGDELETHDVLRPEVTSQLLVDQWTAAELPRETWSLVKDVIQQHVVDQFDQLGTQRICQGRHDPFSVRNEHLPRLAAQRVAVRSGQGAGHGRVGKSDHGARIGVVGIAVLLDGAALDHVFALDAQPHGDCRSHEDRRIDAEADADGQRQGKVEKGGAAEQQH